MKIITQTFGHRESHPVMQIMIPGSSTPKSSQNQPKMMKKTMMMIFFWLVFVFFKFWRFDLSIDENSKFVLHFLIDF